ncbi:hypothetical protein BDN72DRAFT_959865 [Pluteus cervinus]|uniref:Uncharacterized protein n=1 Tax=Pluteus cervinus TaxID=181527 RepID=A0ACD3AU06_9AGAR|nr:hypothetical protein BDN72DRAFT_959865 [Pluteus cervinus]
MSINHDHTSVASRLDLDENDRNIVCHHTDASTNGAIDLTLCDSCRSRSYTYWSHFITNWKEEMVGNSMTSRNTPYDAKLDSILDYVLATNNLKDTRTPPLLGSYPRPSVVELVIGLNPEDIDVIIGYCPQKPAPILFAQWDSPEPPFIEPQLRSFLMDMSRLVDEVDPPHLRDINDTHRHIAKVFMLTFFDPMLDEVPGGQEIKAFVGLEWMLHIIASDGFRSSTFSGSWRRLELFKMDVWFEWIFAEGWKRGVADLTAVKFNPVELVSKFATSFTEVPESHRLENTETLETQITQFLHSHFVPDLKSWVQQGNAPIPFRYTSSSFYMNALHTSNPLLDSRLPLPAHLRLNRHQLRHLLSYNNQEDVYSSKEERQNAYELVLADLGLPIGDALDKHTPDISPILELAGGNCMDSIFECGSIFEVWARGERPGYVWRGRKGTHEDLAICCLELLLKSKPQEWERSLQDAPFEYAKYTWSYHLSHSSPTKRLVDLLDDYTNALSSNRRVLHNDYCHHPTLVMEWLYEAYVLLPNLEPLRWTWQQWRQNLISIADAESASTSYATVTPSITAVTTPCTPPKKKHGVDRTRKKERPSPYANRKVMASKKKGDLEGVEEELLLFT